MTNSSLLFDCGPRNSHRLQYSDIFWDSEAGYNDLSSFVYFSGCVCSTALSCFLITEGVALFWHICGFRRDIQSWKITPNSLTKWRRQLKCGPLLRLPCWEKSWVWWSAVSSRARHEERISCSEARLSPDQQQRFLGWVYVYWFDHGKLVTWALHSSRGSCQSFGSIFVCLVPGGGVVSSSLECLLWVTYVDLPISNASPDGAWACFPPFPVCISPSVI